MLVSVVMVTFNHELFIREAIESVLSQNADFGFELIVSNDCSSDKTDSIISDIIINHPKADFVKYYKQNSNIGMIPNFLFALKQAKGEFIAVLEGDDYWTDSYKLQKQVDFLEKNDDYAGCFHYTQQINLGGEKGKMYGDYGRKLEFSSVDTFSTTALFHTSSFVFRREALFIPEWFTKVVGGDMALFSIVSAKGKLRCLPEIMSVYRKHEGGITNSAIATFENHHKNRIELMNYLNEFHDFKCSNKANQVIVYHEDCLNGKDESVRFISKVKNRLKRIFDLFKRNNNE